MLGDRAATKQHKPHVGQLRRVRPPRPRPGPGAHRGAPSFHLPSPARLRAETAAGRSGAAASGRECRRPAPRALCWAPGAAERRQPARTLAEAGEAASPRRSPARPRVTSKRRRRGRGRWWRARGAEGGGRRGGAGASGRGRGQGLRGGGGVSRAGRGLRGRLEATPTLAVQPWVGLDPPLPPAAARPPWARPPARERKPACCFVFFLHSFPTLRKVRGAFPGVSSQEGPCDWSRELGAVSPGPWRYAGFGTRT